MSGQDIPFPYLLGAGELIHKVLVVTFEMAEGDLRQVIALSRRLEGGGLSLCYHIGRLAGNRFVPDTADCFRHATAQDLDLRLEAVFEGVRRAAKDKFITHVLYDLSGMGSQRAQRDFLAGKGLGHLLSEE